MCNNIKDFNFVLMENLKNNLERKLSELLGFTPQCNFNYNKASDSYIFLLKGENEIYSFEFNFRILYESKEDVLRRYKINNQIVSKSKDDLTYIISEIKDIKYAIITFLFIKPQNTGIGKMIVDIFFEEIKIINKIENVYLNPKNTNAERFWDRIGFYDIKEEEARKVHGYNKVIIIKK